MFGIDVQFRRQLEISFQCKLDLAAFFIYSSIENTILLSAATAAANANDKPTQQPFLAMTLNVFAIKSNLNFFKTYKAYTWLFENSVQSLSAIGRNQQLLSQMGILQYIPIISNDMKNRFMQFLAFFFVDSIRYSQLFC